MKQRKPLHIIVLFAFYERTPILEVLGELEYSTGKMVVWVLLGIWAITLERRNREPA